MYELCLLNSIADVQDLTLHLLDVLYQHLHFPILGRRILATFCRLSPFLRSDLTLRSFLAGIKIFWGTCSKLVRIAPLARGLVWGSLARSLGTPDEIMCEYFLVLFCIYIDSFLPFRF